jgi:hypothetical protein
MQTAAVSQVFSKSLNPAVDAQNGSSGFRYGPIEEREIRLVRLLPGPRGSPIECEMVHSNLDLEPEPWECLSYMWGDPSNPELININGSVVQIRQNLQLALEAIREEGNSRTVWIDALCINQIDALEVSKHVSTMGEIYRRANKVLVWLGQSSDDSDFLFDGHIIPDETWPDSYKWGGPFDSRTANAMLAFYCRPYWTRVWILQEILVAGSLEFFCGDRCMSMRKYRMGFTWFLEIMRGRLQDGSAPSWFTDAVRNDLESSPGCTILRLQYGGKTDTFSLLRLLELCKDCKSQCQLPHDMIYGLIGVLKSSQLGLIAPSYSKTLSELFFDVFITLIVPDTAQDSHYVSLWGYMGKDLVASLAIVQQMLQQPLWDEHVNKFHPVTSVSTASQLGKLRELRLRFWIEGMGAVSEVGDVLSPEVAFEHNSSSLRQMTATQQNSFRAALKELATKDLQSVSQYIGIQYTKMATDNPDVFFSASEDRNSAANEALLFPPTGETSPFITGNGLFGLATSKIRNGDLLYGFNALEGLFLGTNLCLIIRPAIDNLSCGFTIIGRAILLPFPQEQYCSFRDQYRKGKYAEFTFKEDLVTEGTCSAL